MARFFENVGFVTDTTGTGTIAIGPAINATLLTPAESGAEDGDERIPYSLKNGSNIEKGYGTYHTGDPDTFSRDEVIISKIDGVVGTSKIDLVGASQIRFVAHAQDLVDPDDLGTAAYSDIAPEIATIPDEASPSFDAKSGLTAIARLTASGDRELQAPSNPVDGQKVLVEHMASGAARTLSLATGTGAFAFGADITALTATESGKTDFIGLVYNASAQRWRVVAVAKGY